MKKVNGERPVATIGEARDIARNYALEANVTVEQAESAAEGWFDAGKDYDACRRRDLLSYLKRHVAS